jgi:DNA helicase II / ATP-dependent DNA helicase PcrA
MNAPGKEEFGMAATTLELPPGLLADLNQEQAAAASAGHQPLLVIAGAGTGKTTTLVHRVAALIAAGVDPSRILLLTFTRRAAAEMLRRVDVLLGKLASEAKGGPLAISAQRKLWGGTFHAVGTRLLRQFGSLMGLSPEFTILDRSDTEDLLNTVRSELALAKADKRFPLKGTCLEIYSRCVNTQWPVHQVLKQCFPWCAEHEAGLKKLFQGFSQVKEQQQIFDYDDLLLFWHALLQDPATAEPIRQKFDCVLVDEYQDTNTLQAEIVKGLRPDGMGLTVVGDDAQAIYSFRAATVRNILDFPEWYPGTCVIKLEQNYRSTQPLLAATNAVIRLASEGHRKELWSNKPGSALPRLVNCLDESQQTDYVIERILSHREQGIDLKRQVVLFRASHHSLALELELARRNIPFHKFGGLKFVEAAHVKDLLAILRLAENPRDTVSALRVLLLFPGIGPRKAKQLTDDLAAAGGNFDCWQRFTPPAAAQAHWPLFVALMRLLARTTAQAVELATEVHQARMFYRPLLEEKYDHATARAKDLEQLEQIASKYESRGLFLSEISLDPPSSTQDLAQDPYLDEDYLILSTIHSAKGLEWDAVYVLHAADGNIPSDLATQSVDEIEEERRLFYVALSRAKSSLDVIHPQRYYFHGRMQSDLHSYSQRTRFLPDKLLPLFEVLTLKGDGGREAGRLQQVTTTAAVRERFGKMWE